jgi:hypothetical protein
VACNSLNYFVFPTIAFCFEEHVSMAKQPIHSIRFGYIKANIWFNQTKSGDRHNVTVTRLYRDGDLWRESQHFGRDDLLLLAKALDQAHTWIMQQGTVNEPA